MSNALYIGLMSGTSLDGMDAVLVRFNQNSPVAIDAVTLPYTPAERSLLLELCHPGDNEINRLALAEQLIARRSSDAVSTLLERQQLSPSEITAIGSHGQTIRHLPDQGFTLQIGDPSLIAELTGITVVADFRRRDIAAGGQGAPLVPAFHQAVFRTPDVDRVIVNIGGIANITVLPADTSKPVLGFDTGPGNNLMDYWHQKHQQAPYDNKGQWASSGTVCAPMLKQWLEDPYTNLLPPKSTGREYFNPDWLRQNTQGFNCSTADIQATLCRFTAATIAKGIAQGEIQQGEIYYCGGGAFNLQLLDDLKSELPNFSHASTLKLEIAPQWVEAIAFAWLARQRLNHKPGNLPAVTHAKGLRILGGVFSH